MAVLQEPNNHGDLLSYEVHRDFSREEVTLASGNNLTLGAVLGIVSASGKYAEFDPAASDGTQAAVGVLLDDVDASSADAAAVIITDMAILKRPGLVWKAGITAEQKTAAESNLKTARNIKVVDAI